MLYSPHTMKMYDVIIIGGGPAGMMAAGTAALYYPDSSILLIEKNKNLGEKLSITGGGRCNITNAIFDTKEFLKRYGSSEKYLYSTFDQFSVQDTFSFFEKRNLPLTIQAYNRVFPISEKASDVTLIMKNYCSYKNITIKTDTIISKINLLNSKIESIQTTKGESYSAKSYILATGGLSHPETGSTGDGFDWLKQLGHTIKNPTPTLVPWKVSDTWVHDNAGFSIENSKITAYVDSKKYFSFTGKILCTHTGLSGPLILNHSGKLQDALYSGLTEVYLDMYPDKNHKQIDEIILNVFEENKNKKLKNILSLITRISSSDFLIQKYLKYNIETPVNSVSKDFRKSLVQLLKKIPLQVAGLEGHNKSIVADGGISLKEIDTRTMRSTKVSNLFITGDLLDIRRPSGGFSLQLCWTTGFVAGKHCLKK